MPQTEHQPGEIVPEDGRYQGLNVFGSPTGRSVDLRKDERFPALPRGHSWRRLTDDPDDLAL